MARISIIDRADMNAQQARVYDAAKQSSGVVGGPYYAYIRLPALFEAFQNLRNCLGSGPLSDREQQIVNLAVARHYNARYRGSRRCAARSRSASRRPSLMPSTPARCRAFRCARANLLGRGARTAGEQWIERRDLRRRGKNLGAGEPGGAGRHHRQLFHDLPDRQHLRDRPAA